jgi:hypothetical protein
MVLYLVCTSGGAEQAGGKPDGKRHLALYLDPQTPMNPDPFWIGTLTRMCASHDLQACFMHVRTSGGAEQAGGEPDGVRHRALDLDPQTK